MFFSNYNCVPKCPAMSMEEMELCLERGAKITDMIHADGCNVVSFGEMGIGNTSPSSVWMHLLTGISLEQCVGAGSGLDSEGIRHKYNVLKQSVDHYAGDGSAKDIIAWFGGYEMVMAIGGMLRAAELRMIILVDGFIMTNCILAASKLHPEVLSYAIFGHQGDETGHKLVLDAMKVRPLLNLGLALDVRQAHLALFVLEVAEQLDDRAAVQSEMIIGGQQAAQHALGERAAEGVLRGIAYSGKLAVLVSCAAKLGRCVLRRSIFALFGIFRLGSRRAQIVERERRALVALVG